MEEQALHFCCLSAFMMCSTHIITKTNIILLSTEVHLLTNLTCTQRNHKLPLLQILVIWVTAYLCLQALVDDADQQQLCMAWKPCIAAKFFSVNIWCIQYMIEQIYGADCVHDSSKAWPNADFYKMVAMHSISILAFKGRAATWYVERAGAGAGKSEAHMFTVR